MTFKPAYHARRLGVRPRPDTMVDDNAAMRAAMCHSEPLRMKREGDAVRPTGHSADQPAARLKTGQWRHLGKRRCHCPVKDRREGVGE